MGGLLGNAVKRGVSQGVNRAVDRAVGNAVEQAVTGAANKAADAVVPPPPPYQPDPAQLGGMFASFAGAAQGFATEAAKNIKVCPGCGAYCGADTKFCNQCGSPLPELAGIQCRNCGMQNGVGTNFCSGCGAKLSGAA